MRKKIEKLFFIFFIFALLNTLDQVDNDAVDLKFPSSKSDKAYESSNPLES